MKEFRNHIRARILAKYQLIVGNDLSLLYIYALNVKFTSRPSLASVTELRTHEKYIVLSMIQTLVIKRLDKGKLNYHGKKIIEVSSQVLTLLENHSS